jgi:hypothetical protein
MKWLCAALVILGAFAGDTASAQYACTRHIYNNSSCTWAFVQPRGPFVGGISFTGVSRCKPARPDPRRRTGCFDRGCWVPPGCVFEIRYFAPAGLIDTWVEIHDSRNQAQAYAISNGGFGSCPQIVHHGRTGGVSMNEPARGDFSIGQCTW